MVPERDIEVLLARIDRLERRLARVTRTLTVAVTLLLFAAVAVGLSSRPVFAQARAATPGDLVATSLKLVDATGRPRVVLYVDGKAAGLALRDPAGQTRVLLDTDGESSKLAIVGTKQGFPRINLTQQGDFQTLMLEDQKSGVALVHAASPYLLVSGKGSSAELKIDEVFASRQPTPMIVPKLVLKQGDRTVVELPAPPAGPGR
jgi:hypothetical protein